MGNYGYLGITKFKSPAKIRDAYEHNFRIDKAENAIPEKKDLNEILIDMGGADYWEAQQKRERALPKYQDGSKPRSDAVKLLEVVLSYSSELRTPLFNQGGWERDSLEWLQNYFGKDNVISAVCHKDEVSGVAHIHAMVVPERDGGLNASHYMRRKGLHLMRTSYNEVIKQYGLALSRDEVGASHTSMKRQKSAIHQRAIAELPPVRENESADEYRARAQEVFRDARLQDYNEISQANNRASKAINSMKKKISERWDELNAEKDKLAKDKNEVDALLKSLREIKEKNEMIQWRSDRFTEIRAGLAHGYFENPEDKQAFTDEFKELADYGRAYIQEHGLESEYGELYLPDVADESGGR